MNGICGSAVKTVSKERAFMKQFPPYLNSHPHVLLGGVIGLMRSIRTHFPPATTSLAFTTAIPNRPALRTEITVYHHLIQDFARRQFVESTCETLASFTENVLMTHFQASDREIKCYGVISDILSNIGVFWRGGLSPTTEQQFAAIAQKAGQLQQLKDLIRDGTLP